MDVAGKKVWDLNLEEIEYVYNHIHLNNYIYAALNCFHKSKIPLNKIITLKKEKIPEPLHKYSKQLIDLSPYLGNDDSRTIRINYTYYAFKLFQAFKEIQREDTSRTIELLATLAYIPIIAEKNDDFNLWHHPVIRYPDERIQTLFNAIKREIHIPSFLQLCLYKDEEIDEYMDSPLRSTFLFMRAVQSIIIMTENNEDRQKIEQAWKNVERNMVKHEQEHGLCGSHYKGNIKRAGQIRYRNTIYLYGGDFFRRMKDYDSAFEWYTKDIYFRNLPDLFGFYLTDMKTTERLICAYAVVKKIAGSPAIQSEKERFLIDLITDCMYTILRNAATYADTVLDFIASKPGIDLSLGRLPDNGQYKLYAGEASREPFFISLLYNNIVNNIKYEDIEYHKFFAW